ncbi:fucose-1-phosphate guanylyltransferase-like [Centruroides vittatus]|uniref:fucose-1-phosphate guanylyltransferase-like n=1 Tax=Centruroides vittatus TaxID=120091 RepID=UPI00350EB89A
MDHSDDSIKTYMKQIIDYYESIRGKSKKVLSYSFWDLVVVTTSDDAQKNAFDVQISLKIERGELPVDVPYHVIADPPGFKIGSGGSTLIALQNLLTIYGEKLFAFKILLIHAGGRSQRIPCHSILGKLFVSLPLGNPMFQMLDLILAIYWPFTKQMDAGVFLVSSDAFITYYLTEDDDLSWTFKDSDFTALAHPSSIEIGTKHGVYVLPSLSSELSQKSCFTIQCLEILQKPSAEIMRDKEAIVRTNVNGTSEEIVYSDSVFYFSSKIMRKFVDYIQSTHIVTCELDAYGDFLQGLGPNGSSSYIYDTKNVVEISDDLIRTRENLHHLLQGSSINVIVLQKSKFYHLGTIGEYIENLCTNKILAEEMNFQKWIFSVSAKSGLKSSSFGGTVMHSCIHPNSVVDETTVLEYCDFPLLLKVNEKCIVSGCLAYGEKLNEVPVQIPSRSLIHTASVRVDGTVGYITIAFHFEDDLKSNYPFQNITSIKYFGRFLGHIRPTSFGCEKYSDLFDGNTKVYSLWTAKLFQMQLTMEDSLQVTLKMLQNVLNENNTFEVYSNSIFPYLSMEDILKYKNVEKTIEYRNKLWEKIVKYQS